RCVVTFFAAGWCWRGVGTEVSSRRPPVALQGPPRVPPRVPPKFHQSIMAMPRGLDHIVHAVRDLDAAADLYRRVGFMVGARNRHAWGTHNQLVQFPGFFMELLTVAEPEKLTGEG